MTPRQRLYVAGLALLTLLASVGRMAIRTARRNLSEAVERGPQQERRALSEWLETLPESGQEVLQHLGIEGAKEALKCAGEPDCKKRMQQALPAYR